MEEKEKEIAELLRQSIEGLGYLLYSLRLSGGTLYVQVDHKQPIGLEEIVKVSEEVSALLDKADPIDGPYTLDVSSAGAEKRIELSALPEYAGSYVNLHLSTPYKGENVLEGTITRYEDGTIFLSYMDKARKMEAAIPLKDVDKARLAIKF